MNTKTLTSHNKHNKLWRWTGILGIVLTILTMVEIPLYFIYEGAPPDNNVLTRLLINCLLMVGFIIFFGNFRAMVIRLHPAYEWTATLLFGSVLVYSAVTLVANSLEAGAVIAATETIDPTIAANGIYLLYGSIGRLLSAIFLGLAGYITLKTVILPRWTGWLALVFALVSAAFIPSLYFGNNPAEFYSANGWGTTAVAAGMIMYWVVIAGICMFMRARRA